MALAARTERALPWGQAVLSLVAVLRFRALEAHARSRGAGLGHLGAVRGGGAAVRIGQARVAVPVLAAPVAAITVTGAGLATALSAEATRRVVTGAVRVGDTLCARLVA